MKLTIDHNQLADAVTFAARALPARPPIPVLAGLKLNAEFDDLTVDGFDYEASAHTSTTATVTEPGSVLVSGRLLADITRVLRHDVHLTSDGTRLTIESGTARYTLHTLPIEEYPTLPLNPLPSGTVPGADFATAVTQVAAAAGTDDTLPVLTGVKVAVDGDTLIFAATDRYRFAVRSLPWKPTGGTREAAALIPAKTLLDSAKALASDSEVTIALTDDQGIVGLGTTTRRTTTRLLEGDLPAYKSLFPTEFIAQATVDIDALAAAIKRVALVAARNTPLRFRFSADQLTIEGGSSDDAQAIDRVDATSSGDIEIAFNPAFLLDGLAAIEGDTVRFGFTSPHKPALLRADDASDHDLRYLLMPVRLAG